jgi:hypothetical protein
MLPANFGPWHATGRRAMSAPATGSEPHITDIGRSAIDRNGAYLVRSDGLPCNRLPR